MDATWCDSLRRLIRYLSAPCSRMLTDPDTRTPTCQSRHYHAHHCSQRGDDNAQRKTARRQRQQHCRERHMQPQGNRKLQAAHHASTLNAGPCNATLQATRWLLVRAPLSKRQRQQHRRAHHTQQAGNHQPHTAHHASTLAHAIQRHRQRFWMLVQPPRPAAQRCTLVAHSTSDTVSHNMQRITQCNIAQPTGVTQEAHAAHTSMHTLDAARRAALQPTRQLLILPPCPGGTTTHAGSTRHIVRGVMPHATRHAVQ